MNTRDPQSSIDRDLLAGLRQGETNCAEELARRYHGPLVRYCTTYLRDAGRAEDVTQEVFGKINGPEALPEGEIKPWLYRIARNRCLDILRRQQKSPTHHNRLRTGVDAPTMTAGPGTKLARAERRSLIRSIVEAMPEDYRSVLILKYFEGFSRAEIAESLGVSDATVKGRLVRASQHLEEQLRQYTWTMP